ncbi:HD domain-containing protein [Sulfoacidibacillus thermotolerans]|uniref:HD/PDEase domain-containing protein n=1 Tax=Sulfoacidibacillus thermotolerans TaxID=1765684 RepID=A0A2U3DAM6_SULT2|nr:HD domain-containing protein [Sulfoacidibacillus thermotolerans]PWI58337.1 hypothetical protein BM613_03715 [Sulfoacidibacillus thermotolerans]
MTRTVEVSILSPEQQRDTIQLMSLYQTDQAHCERVMHFSRQLFTLTKSVGFSHEQPLRQNSNEHQLLLRLTLAALLHDIGHFINDKGHHKHSRYLIQTARQTTTWEKKVRDDVAALAFTHRKKADRSWLITHFKGSKELFQLAAILRVADGLDRKHAAGVRILGGQFEQDRYVLEVTGLQATHAKRLAEKKADAWKMAFGHSLALKIR